MISRRNIRVKVMQTLYSLEAIDPALPPEQAIRMLQKHFDQSSQLFTYLVFAITEVARYAETDSRLKASKHLPTQADLAVNTKIAGNTLLWQILEHPGFRQGLSDWDIRKFDDHELTRKIYGQMLETDEYRDYVNKASREKKDEKQMLEFIFNQLMLPDEYFISHLEEHFIHWDDDADMMQQLVTNFLHKPGSYNFQQMISPEKLEFGIKLLATALDKKEYCLELIRPRLKNWDAERIAALDMIVMRMGVSELLYFETIPAKVTINEYIDLAKEYSTPQSGQFVNGILDSIHKDLVQEGRLKKVDYKKQ
jgi:N utilization substance protein B